MRFAAFTDLIELLAPSTRPIRRDRQQGRLETAWLTAK